MSSFSDHSLAVGLSYEAVGWFMGRQTGQTEISEVRVFITFVSHKVKIHCDFLLDSACGWLYAVWFVHCILLIPFV